MLETGYGAHHEAILSELLRDVGVNEQTGVEASRGRLKSFQGRWHECALASVQYQRIVLRRTFMPHPKDSVRKSI